MITLLKALSRSANIQVNLFSATADLKGSEPPETKKKSKRIKFTPTKRWKRKSTSFKEVKQRKK
jgi:hypothetical protein